MTITVYSKSNCQACVATKMQLENAKLQYNVVDIEADQEAMQRVLSMGYRQLPVVTAGDDHWSGFRPDKISALQAQA